ncbi:hypothetical protein [Pampinifervens florentissimum]|uniref:hypothetical protein n=1 Tax=Pampinifervens florentissimum TaxID=1632019 RepID=UPI0013B4830B|nr:hypothetical protein [Hydrogenobacter sp. T-8]QID33894.1 hypothetical protein G3M65_08975 [Hydrogenobacter sp. T-8]
MRKSLLAVAALMGASVLPAHAVSFKVAEDVSGNMGFKAQIWGQYLGERTSGNKSALDFSLNNVRLYANGNVGKYMYFFSNLDFTPASSRATDAAIGLKFMDELRIQAGLYRTPFSRAALTDSYTYLIPTGYFYGGYNVAAPLPGPTTYRNAGLTVWGDIADAMVKYYIGVFDGPYNNSTGTKGKDNLMYTVRLQFTPTMLGFKGEKGYGLRDTYLGRQNVLSFGVGYATQKCGDTTAGACNTGAGNLSFTTKAWTVDAKHEQKFGDFIPNVELAYFDVKDVNTGKDDRKGYYLQVGGIYDQVVGIGKPGLALRYDYSEEKKQLTGAKTKYKRFGGAVNYFLKGQDALIQLAVDSVDRPTGQKDYTDVTLAFQVQF